jgi:hypothetical protein
MKVTRDYDDGRTDLIIEGETKHVVNLLTTCAPIRPRRTPCRLGKRRGGLGVIA